MVFDGLKRLVSMDDPDRGVSTIDYDAGGNRVETRDAKGQRITYTYDGANRLLTEDYHNEDLPSVPHYAFDPALPVTPANRPDVAYFYDQPVTNLDLGDGSLGMARNTKGMLAYVWDLSGEEHRSYDARQHEAWTVKRVRDPRDGKLVSFRSQQMFDSLDHLAQVIFPDNDSVTYSYNDRGLLDRIAGSSATILARIEYAPSGQARTTKYGNGVQSSRAYDARSRLSALTTARESDLSHPYLAFAYEFDPVSNLEWIRDQRPESTVPAANPRRNTQRFDYDDLSRLSRVRYGFGPIGDDAATDGKIEYRYDRIGNLIAQTSDILHFELGKSVTDLGPLIYGGNAGASGRVGRSPSDPGPHALSRSGSGANAMDYLYDANGNMAQKDGAALAFDFRDRLISVEDESMRADYTYDFQHRRITKSVTVKQGGTNVLGSAASPEVTFYVSPSFEVRPPELPVKYLWDGPSRVARVTGSLSANPRIQRLRLATGWNLVSLVVSVTDLQAQLSFPASSNTSGPIIEGAYLWNPASHNFGALSPGAAIPAGSVLWLKASAAGTLSLRGAYVDPGSPLNAIEAGFLSWVGFDALTLAEPLPANLAAWAFDPDAQRWLTRLPESVGAVASIPACLAPGSAVFLAPQAPLNLTSPDVSLRVRYYHPDHLGSAGVMTDQTGALVEETAYYPFGVVRQAHQPRGVREAYQFTQKERDAESGLQYFEARYLAGIFGRFISVDPRYAEPLQMGGDKMEQLLSNPQDFNLYTYARNNPLAYTDPTGYDPEAAGGETLPFKSVLPCKRTDIVGHGAHLTPDEVERSATGGYGLKEEVLYKGTKAGYFVVPEGTTITAYAPHGFSLAEELGEAIQLGTLHPQQFKVTYHPGDVIPNYLVMPPGKDMAVHHISGVDTVTVSGPTSLNTLIKPGMGSVNLAMCLTDFNPPWKTTTGTMGLLHPGDDPVGGSFLGYPEKKH
jgi:RHS repeat-associated protein